MEENRWVDEDVMNNNMLSDREQNNSHDAPSNGYSHLEPNQEFDFIDQLMMGEINIKMNGLHKRYNNKNGYEDDSNHWRN